MTVLPEAPKKWLCEECGWVGEQYLCAPNPFDPDDDMIGCPSCKVADTITHACQHEGCNKAASAGTPGALGYRYAWTCWKHTPRGEL